MNDTSSSSPSLSSLSLSSNENNDLLSSFFQNKIVVVTGGASGIGFALAKAFAQHGSIVVIIDKQAKLIQNDYNFNNNNNNNDNNNVFLSCDVTNESQMEKVIRTIQQKYGRIDIYCSNAGIVLPKQQQTEQQQQQQQQQQNHNTEILQHSISQWETIFRVNVLSHVIALKFLLPQWNQGIGDGIFCITASAAGLLTMIGDASYGVSKAAAVALAEHLAICSRNSTITNNSNNNDPLLSSRIQLHCLCPQAVDTPLAASAGILATSNSGSSSSITTTTTVAHLNNDKNNNDNNNNTIRHASMTDGILTPEYVAECTLKGICQGDFFIFPHENVPKYFQRKAMNHPKWIQGMQRLRKNNLQLLTPTNSNNNNNNNNNNEIQSNTTLRSKL